ncbi:MAG: hypothetical protein ACFFCW_04190 [Candidatus Hodarchaeota archaeon]
MSETPAFQSLDIAFNSAQDKLRFQSEQWNSIDQKNAVVLAVYGIMMAVFLASDVGDAFIVYRKTILIAWMSAIVSGMLCSLVSLRPKTIDMPPKIDVLISEYLNADAVFTKKIILSGMKRSIGMNSKVLKRKTRMLSFSIEFFLPVSLGISAVAIFINLIVKG